MGTGAARLGAGAGAFRSLSNSTSFNNVWFIGWKGHAHDRKRGEDERSKAEKVITSVITANHHPHRVRLPDLTRRVSVWPASCSPAISGTRTARKSISCANCPCRGGSSPTEPGRASFSGPPSLSPGTHSAFRTSSRPHSIPPHQAVPRYDFNKYH